MGKEEIIERLEEIAKHAVHVLGEEPFFMSLDDGIAIREAIDILKSAQPTLYGYKIEHLAYIATVMEKEGVTADYAVRTFDDISRALRMIIEEAQERVMETLNERYDLQTECD